MVLLRSWDQGLIPVRGVQFDIAAASRRTTYAHSLRFLPMTAEIASVAGHVLTVKVSGILTEPELTSMQAAAAKIVGTGGQWRLLVLTENFKGWERGGAWNDFSFSESDASIERMAIVGDRKWEDLALLFTAKGLRSFPIEFFEPEQQSAAKDWLAAR
jgi:hypothetical protein